MLWTRNRKPVEDLESSPLILEERQVNIGTRLGVEEFNPLEVTLIYSHGHVKKCQELIEKLWYTELMWIKTLNQ